MLRVLRVISLPVVLLFVSGFTECYKQVTKSQLPSHIKTVAVPAFQNNALRFKIEHRFTEAVMNELIRRGHGLRVQSEREGADAVIEGVVKSFGFSGVLFSAVSLNLPMTRAASSMKRTRSSSAWRAALPNRSCRLWLMALALRNESERHGL